MSNEGTLPSDSEDRGLELDILRSITGGELCCPLPWACGDVNMLNCLGKDDNQTRCPHIQLPLLYPTFPQHKARLAARHFTLSTCDIQES